MTEFPLLIFPKPENTDRTKQERKQNLNIHKPNTQRQIERLSPKFQELQTIFETQKAEIQHSMIGLELEQVLVMEIIGSIENFLNAVKKIEGLEWLAEIESDEIEPDEDYYNEKNPEIKLTGRLYLVMTNQRALEELLSLWKKYKENPDIKFKRGLGKFKELFENLKDIRRWDVKDRLIETGVLESWKEDVNAGLIKFVLCEIELWFRQNSTVREQSTKQVTNLVEEVGGRVLTQLY